MSTPVTALPFHGTRPSEPPVTRVPVSEGQRAWLATSYNAVAAVLSDPRFGMTPPGQDGSGNDTLFQDGEAHARLRRLVSRAFTPRAVEALRPAVERLADRHAAAVAESGPPADLVADVAGPVALRTICDMLGVRVAERDRFCDLAQAVGAASFFGAEEAAAAERAWVEMTDHAAGMVADKRRVLGDDLLSALVAVRDADDGRLSDGELAALVATLVAAGLQTARNSIAVGVLQLMTEGRMAEPARDPAATGPIVEELLRHQAGTVAEPFPRWAHADVELEGVGIARGDLVLVRLAQAHHDPAHFAGPDRFVPGRNGDSPHLAFGRGPHHCLGAALARMELTAVVDALSRRLPGLRPAVQPEELEWVRGQTDAGPRTLPVTWG